MFPHPDTDCRIADHRREDFLLAADRHRLARSASPAPPRPAAGVSRTELAGLVARLRTWRHGPPVAALGDRLPQA